MLEIILKSNGGKLDLLPGTKLEMNRPADAFDEDMSTGEFTLPIEIPWTDNNKLLLGFSERMQNYVGDKISTWECDVFSDGYPELLESSLNLLSKDGLLSYSTGKFTANISGKKGAFGNTVNSRMMKDFKFGGPITWTEDLSSREFATKHSKGFFPQYDNFAFAPLVIQEYFDTEKNYYGEFLVQDTVNNIIITGSGADDWTMDRPTSDDPLVKAEPGTSEYVDYRTIPFFKAKYITKALLAELGYIIEGNALDSALLDELFIFNTRSIEDYNMFTYTDSNRKIIPANHLPDIPAVDFLRSIFKFLNIYPVFTGGFHVLLKSRTDFINKRNILDVSDYLLNSFTSEYLPTEEQGGYSLDYEHDPEDSYFGEAVRDITEKTLVATVATKEQLATLNIGQPLTTDHIAMVEAENTYYVVADSSSSPVLWSAYAENLHPLKVGNGNKASTLGAGTLASYMQMDEGTGLQNKLSKLCTRQKGCYINNKKVLVKNNFTLRLFFIKKQVIGGNIYPVSFNHRTNFVGTGLTNYSLALNIDKSLGSLHKEWQEIQTRPERYTITLQADRVLINKLDQFNMIMAKNVLFVPTEINTSVPMGDTVAVKALPL